MKKIKTKTKECTFTTNSKWIRCSATFMSHKLRDKSRVTTIEVGYSPVLCKEVNGVWTPEELFVVFIESRIMITFILLAQQNQIEILSYQSHTENRMIKDNGIPHLVHIYIYPEITVKKESDVSNLKDILNQAEKLCLSSIAVSINVEIKSHIMVHKTE